MDKKTVLLVDDDVHIVKVLALKLKNAQFEVVTASNGAEALAVIESRMPDLMITDFSMPEMTGLELVRTLRNREGTKDLPIVMLTARGQIVEEWEGGEAPRVDALMSKPFSPREILGKVEELLAARIV